MNLIREFDFTEWNPKISKAKSQQAIAALEGGYVISLPHLPFVLSEDEKRFLSESWSDQKSKNISLRPEALYKPETSQIKVLEGIKGKSLGLVA